MKHCLALLLLAGCATKEPPPPTAHAAPTAMAPTATPLAQQPKSYTINLSWSPYVDPTASKLIVWEGTDPNGVFNAVSQVPTSTTSAAVGGLGYNQTWYFRISALGPNGESAPSGIVYWFKRNSQQPGSGGPYGSTAQ